MTELNRSQDPTPAPSTTDRPTQINRPSQTPPLTHCKQGLYCQVTTPTTLHISRCRIDQGHLLSNLSLSKACTAK
ncbi:hypothetical protein PGTUg99_007716 [Puccinia graminis f. sp. tritici]|uniref:Uncharacterized protein n=1 Tax=Puccinia graminis f. sp. tritici TaxID=56615 RepID=A0A5B0N730_PUCGR|nr:hypothetical protein PGTUg99_007716 [Puccinia graminis f. sp. tritici]